MEHAAHNLRHLCLLYSESHMRCLKPCALMHSLESRENAPPAIHSSKIHIDSLGNRLSGYLKTIQGPSLFHASRKSPILVLKPAFNTDADVPIKKLTSILQALLNNQGVDMGAVEWLWTRLTQKDFRNGALPTTTNSLAFDKGTETDVKAFISILLAPPPPPSKPSRRNSRLSDVSNASDPRSLFTICKSESSNASHHEHLLRYVLDDNWPLPYELTPVLERILSTAHTWEFNVFEMHEATDGHTLSALAFWLLQTSGLIEELGLAPDRLANFLRATERSYMCGEAAPYHNSMHAADVLQTMHALMTLGGIITNTGKRDSIALLAGYLAAAVHDMNHKGVNNEFLIKTGDPLAILYNDESPLENHHAASCFMLLQRSECNFLHRMARDKRDRLRKLTIAMVLATDMKRHISLVSAFRSHVEVEHLRQIPRKPSLPSFGSTGQSKFAPSAQVAQRGGHGAAASPVGLNDQVLTLQMALKCADLGHCSSPWDVHVQWVERLQEEFFLQGDREEAAKLPIFPLSDRSKGGVSTSQVEFLSMVAIPTFEVWTSAFPKAYPFTKQARNNLTRWKLAREEPLLATTSVNLPVLEPRISQVAEPVRTASEDLMNVVV